MEFFTSPSTIEVEAKRIPRRFARKIAESSNDLFRIVTVAFIILASYATFRVFDGQNDFTHFRGLEIIRLFSFGTLFLLGFSVFSTWVKRSLQAPFQFSVLCIVWYFICQHFFGELELKLKIMMIFSLPVDSILGFLLIRYKSDKKWLWTLAYSLIFWSYFSILTNGLTAYPSSLVMVFFRMKHFLFWIMIVYTSLRRPQKRIKALTALMPVNTLFGILWPVTGNWAFRSLATRQRIWWRGAIQVVFALILIWILLGAHKFVEPYLEGAFFDALRNYIYSLMALVIFASLFVGLARMYGYRIKDATNNIWLSRNPSEFWKRGLVYQYEFLFNYVFFPLKRKIRGAAVAIAISFFGFFINKGEIYAFLAGMISSQKESPSVLFETHLLLILVHWLLFQLVLLTWRFYFIDLGKHRTVKAHWFSILMTHSVLVLVFLVGRLLKPHIAQWLLQ